MRPGWNRLGSGSILIKAINMTDAWLDGSAVVARLAIKPQTLYAYVSRGRIEARLT